MTVCQKVVWLYGPTAFFYGGYRPTATGLRRTVLQPRVRRQHLLRTPILWPNIVTNWHAPLNSGQRQSASGLGAARIFILPLVHAEGCREVAHNTQTQ